MQDGAIKSGSGSESEEAERISPGGMNALGVFGLLVCHVAALFGRDVAFVCRVAALGRPVV